MRAAGRGAGLVSLLLLVAACAHARPATVARSRSIAERESRRAWIDERLRIVRGSDLDAADGARGELERGGVDWRSFLTPVRGSTNGQPGWYSEAPKNHVLRQLTQKLNVVRDVRQILGIRDRAGDLARDGSVLDSAFFTNHDVAANDPAAVIEEVESRAPRGRISIVEAKTEGTSEGFIGVDERGDRFIFTFDPPDFPEMSTAAEVIGSTLVRLAGYNVPWPTIVVLDDLALAPEAAEEGLGPAEVERFRARRAAATRMIDEGFAGPWTYSVFRDRRALRGLAVFGAWLNNPDQVDHNTLVEIFDAEAGLARYYVIDFSGALGASSARVKDPWDGYLNNKLDVQWGLIWPLRVLSTPFGFRPPWDPDQPVVSPAVGRFDAELDPRLWKPYYPNLAYEDLDDEDAAWAARLIGAFSDELIDAVVGLGRYTHARDAAHVADTLKRRRDVIVRTYLDEDS